MSNNDIPQFQRRVFQISPEERKIHNTSKENLFRAPLSSDRVLSHSSPNHRPKHRDVYFPLLIKIYALQEQIQNLRGLNNMAFPDERKLKDPKEIQQTLEEIIKEIRESQRWNEGVISQAEKGLDDLQMLYPQQTSPTTAKSSTWIKRLMRKLRRNHE